VPSDTTSPPSAPSGDEKRLSFVIADDEPFGPHTPFQHIAAWKRVETALGDLVPGVSPGGDSF
jgi:hypothetical protein